MDPDHDYHSKWPELFGELPTRTREAVLAALRKSADIGAPPSRTEATILVDFAAGRISAREYSRQTLAHLMGDYGDLESSRFVEGATTANEPLVMTPAPARIEPPPLPLMDHDVAALAFVRGEVTVEQYLQNARSLRRLA